MFETRSAKYFATGVFGITFFGLGYYLDPISTWIGSL